MGEEVPIMDLSGTSASNGGFFNSLMKLFKRGQEEQEMAFFNKVFSGNKATPKQVAKDRLRLILIHDRGELPNEVLEKIKTELLEVLAKYIEIKDEDMDITVASQDSVEGEAGPALIANIPIKNDKR